MLTSAALAQSPCDSAGAAELLLEVEDGSGEPQLHSFWRDEQGRLWAEAQTLRIWRLRPVAPSLRAAGMDWHALDAIQGLRFEYDACTQSLQLDLRDTPRALQRLAAGRADEPRPAAVQATGGYLNVDTQALWRENSDARAAALFDAGFFNHRGRAEQTGTLTQDAALRLDSVWHLESPDTLSRLRLGDSVSAAGSWGLPLRYGGLRWATDYSLRPYFVSFPQPTLAGSAALPSTLDVYIADSLRARQDVEGGAFRLSDVPALSGGGEAVLVLRDPLGRETRSVQPFYVSPQLLRRGLSDFSLDAGWQRRDYGLRSNEYGDAFAAYTLRHGWHDDFTSEVRAEVRDSGAATGVSGLWLLGNAGLLSATAAYGGSDRAQGGYAQIGFERDQLGRYGWGWRTRWSEPGFRQLGADDDQAPSRRMDFLRANLNLERGISLVGAYAYEQRRAAGARELITLGYSARVARSAQFNLTATRVREGGEHTESLQASLSWMFGGQYSGGLSARGGASESWRASVERAAEGPLGNRYSAAHEQGSLQRSQIAGEWGGTRGGLHAEVESGDGGDHARVGARSGLAWLAGDGVFWTRPVMGSFGVVHLDGLPGTGVYLDQRLVARTDDRGRALVPDLRPYEHNRIALRPEDVPIELPLADLEQSVVPRLRSGLRVEFAAQARTVLDLTLVDASGQPLPEGTEAVDDAGAAHPVGRGGRVYLELAPGASSLRVQTPEGDCRVDLAGAASAAVLSCLP